jgi:hypothetical protein
MAYLKLAKTFGPYVAIALLIFAVLWLRGDVIGAKSERDLANVQVGLLQQANAANVKIIEAFGQQREDNDKIAEAVAEAVASNNRAVDLTRQRLREAQDEPGVRDWYNEPVPGSVQDALTGG